MSTTPWFRATSPAEQQRVAAAWKDAPLANLELLGMLLDTAREQVLEFAPEIPADTTVEVVDNGDGTLTLSGPGVTENGDGTISLGVTEPPTRYALAQLQQAKHLWNSGRVAANGETGADGFSFAPRPLDKDIQRIIRPIAGVASVF